MRILYAAAMSNNLSFFASILLGLLCTFSPKYGYAHEDPVLESAHIELLCSEQGAIKYKLSTNKVLRYENGDCTYPEGVYIEFYEDNSAEVSVTGSANSVRFFSQKNIYEFSGDVEVKNLRDTAQLNTEELYWSPEREVFYTDKFVRVETPKELFTGEGLTAKQDLSYYTTSKAEGLFNMQ
ncbi:MAG: LPS export ABC transporter periplasmic protein LptC [Bacteroidota bacterium]